MGKLDQYCFDGTNALSLKKLPTDSKKDQVCLLYTSPSPRD